MIKEHTLLKINLLDIEFSYPDSWKYAQEDETTWTFQDEFSGSFRISIITEEPGFDLDKFLHDSFQNYQELDPVWKTFNDRKYLCFEQLPVYLDDTTGLYFYLSGSGNKLISCSYAYEKEVVKNTELHESFEDIEQVLNSLRYIRS